MSPQTAGSRGQCVSGYLMGMALKRHGLDHGAIFLFKHQTLRTLTRHSKPTPPFDVWEFGDYERLMVFKTPPRSLTIRTFVAVLIIFNMIGAAIELLPPINFNHSVIDYFGTLYFGSDFFLKLLSFPRFIIVECSNTSFAVHGHKTFLPSGPEQFCLLAFRPSALALVATP
jgi:hypothetical protein